MSFARELLQQTQETPACQVCSHRAVSVGLEPLRDEHVVTQPCQPRQVLYCYLEPIQWLHKLVHDRDNWRKWLTSTGYLQRSLSTFASGSGIDSLTPNFLDLTMIASIVTLCPQPAFGCSGFQLRFSRHACVHGILIRSLTYLCNQITSSSCASARS
jgi:hypothetical protein